MKYKQYAPQPKLKVNVTFLVLPMANTLKSHKPHIPTIHYQKAMETWIENKMTAKMHISDCLWLNYMVTE